MGSVCVFLQEARKSGEWTTADNSRDKNVVLLLVWHGKVQNSTGQSWTMFKDTMHSLYLAMV